MSRRTNLAGQTFGELTVIRYSHNNLSSRSPMWLCRCSCGTEKIIAGYALTNGHYKSCGCKQVEKRDVGAKAHIGRDRINGTRKSALKSKLHVGNRSGHKGVTFVSSRNKWRAYIGFKGKQITLGYFDKKQDAIAAREAAEEKYHKPYLEDDNGDK